MTKLDFKMPDIGEGVTEGEIVEWFVKEGDAIAEDDPMVEVMTDKATVTIGAPCDGRVGSLHFEVGQVAAVGEVILTLESGGAPEVSRQDRSSGPSATAVGDIQDSLPGAALFESSSETGRAPSPPEARGAGRNGGTVPRRQSPVRPPSAAQRRARRTSERASPEIAYFEAKPLATPATRRLAKEMDVDLRRIRPTGPLGRVTREDVRASIRGAMAQDRPHDSLEERTPIVGMRRKIAERMAHAKSTAAHFTFVEECDASRLIEMRERLQHEAARRGVRLTYISFIVKAVTDALGRHPLLNSAVDESKNELVTKRYYNIGVAVATDAGLVVPVVKHADRKRLFEVAIEVERLSAAAREGTLAPDDLRNSTFTITSLGRQSGLLATPILNHPEVGILGVHRIKEKPVVRDGQVVVGNVMLLSLSFDHRIVDGHVGAAFAYDVIDTLENPTRLFNDFL
ncbi:MAG: dihydrolipoamide acetyltransferase family protein [Myxococcota bacterium]